MTAKKTALALIIALSCLLASVSVWAQTLDLSFDGVDYAEIFEVVGESAGFNVLVDPEVQGKGSFRLQGVTFTEALDLISVYTGFEYRITGNTLLVASPERLAQLEERSVRYVRTQGIAPAQVLEALALIMPRSDVYVQPEGGLVILSGSQNVLDQAEELIRELDKAAMPKEAPRQDRTILEIFQDISAELGVNLIADPSLTATRLYIDVRNQNPQELIEQIQRLTPLKVEQTEHSLVVGSASVPSTERLKVYRLNYAEPAATKTALSLLIPEQNIQVDSERKSIIVRGTDEQLADVDLFVIEFDQPQPQVVLEVWVHEISTDALQDLGVDWEGVPSFTSGDAPVFLELEWQPWDLILALKILEEKGDAKLLANPKVTTLSGQPASIFVGDRVPVVLTGEEGQRTLEFLESGINLRVTPRISDDDYITILVQPEVSTFIWRADTAYPQIRTREAVTNVRVKDGQPFVLGGLLQEEENESIRSIPFLSQLPLLGKLFQWKETKHKQTEMTIFVVPRIVGDDEGVVNQDFFTQAR